MEGELKNFPPSENKLKRLREQGIVPRSRDLTVFASIAGLVLSIMLIRQAVTGAFAEAVQAAWSGSGSFGKTAVEDWLRRAAGLGFLLLMPAAVIGLLVGAFQTGFLIAGHLVGFQLGRVFDFGNRFKLVRSAAIGAVLRAVAMGAVCWIVCRQLLEWVATVNETAVQAYGSAPVTRENEIFSQFVKPMLEQGAKEIGSVLLSLTGLTFLFGIISRFQAVMAFRAEHSMSRGEIEAENRELESSPELRRKIGELREE